MGRRDAGEVSDGERLSLAPPEWQQPARRARGRTSDAVVGLPSGRGMIPDPAIVVIVVPTTIFAASASLS
jgi:hypothetical protein